MADPHGVPLWRRRRSARLTLGKFLGYTVMAPKPKKKHDFVVYGRPGCPYSVEASKLGTAPLRPVEEMPAEYKQLSSQHNTVPKVFDNHEFVGGLEEMKAYMRSKQRSEKCARRKRECHDSCFTTAELREMAAAHNATGKGRPIDAAAPRLKLAAALRSAANAVGKEKACPETSERCVMRRLPLSADKRNRLELAFSPDMPRTWKNKPDTWLTNFDIDAVMLRYVQHHPSLLFLGVQPMDFRHRVSKGGKCVSDLCGFSAAALDKKYTKLAAVFNLDYHTQSGSHWVAMAAIINPKDPRYGVYYFDSVGKKPTPEVDEFVTALRAQLKALHGVEPRYAFNNHRHQKGNAECGMFAMYFIDRMLDTRLSFTGVCKLMLDDKLVHAYRAEMFQA